MADISKRLDKAEKLVQKGKLDEAVAEYAAACREDPGNDAASELLGDVYLLQNKPGPALNVYNCAFDRAAERNDGPRAVLLFRKIAKLGAQDAARMLAAGRFLEKQKPEEAPDLFRQAAQMFLEAGDAARALEALRHLAATDEKNPEAHYRLAELAESMGEKGTAARALVRVSELLRDQMGSGETLELLERACRLSPGDAALAQTLAGELLRAGNAARAAELLEALPPLAFPARNRLLAEAQMALADYARAEELLWQAGADPNNIQLLMQVVEGYLGKHQAPEAVRLLDTLKRAMFSAGRRAEFIDFAARLEKKGPPPLELLEFLAALYCEINRDALLHDTLGRLFDGYIGANQFAKGTAVLERMVDIDAYDAGHSKRLEQLAGCLEPSRYEAIAARLGLAAAARTPPGARLPASPPPSPARAPAARAAQAAPPEQSDAAVLDDLILQVEIFLQYGLREKAIERLERIAQEFPGEEARNEKLRAVYAAADYAPAASAAAATSPSSVTAADAEEPLADITRVSEIARGIYRQGTVKAVLSTAVNEVGKTWQVSRCVAGLCVPGKPPSAVLEYCAPGMVQSDVKSIVRLITTLVGLTADGNPLAVEDAASSARLKPLAPVLQATGIQSLLALPLLDADQLLGVLVLEQCSRMRRWRANEIMLVKNLADQIVNTVSHVKLRSLMRSLAVHDERSGLLNRNSYISCLLAECERAQKQCMPLSVILFGFGHGQQAIRERGQPAVEALVSEAARALVGHLRQNDVAVRYDVGSVALVLPDTAGKDGVMVVEKLRKVLAASKPAGQEPLPVAAGVAEAVLQGQIDPVDSVTEIINRVELALEAAEQEGDSATKLLSPMAQQAAPE
jgi:diguanylate cyclase (GGDEF)-like protein